MKRMAIALLFLLGAAFGATAQAQPRPGPNWGGGDPKPSHVPQPQRSIACYAYSSPAGWQVQCSLNTCEKEKAAYDAGHPTAKAIGCAPTIYCRGGKCFADQGLCQSVMRGPCDGYSSTGPVMAAPKPPPPPGPTNPSISSMNRTTGYNGDELVITGQRFGTAPGRVLFKERGGSKTALGQNMDWSDGRIRVLVNGYQRSTTADSPAEVVVFRADDAQSNSWPFTLQKQKVQNCYAYSTKGTDRYQIACQPAADSCNAAMRQYAQQNANRVDVTGCSQAVSCYWYGLDINKAEANKCFTNAADCDQHRRSDFVIGTKSGYCYEQSIAGPARRY